MPTPVDDWALWEQEVQAHILDAVVELTTSDEPLEPLEGESASFGALVVATWAILCAGAITIALGAWAGWRLVTWVTFR
jgi:hypothetical protein